MKSFLGKSKFHTRVSNCLLTRSDVAWKENNYSLCREYLKKCLQRTAEFDKKSNLLDQNFELFDVLQLNSHSFAIVSIFAVEGTSFQLQNQKCVRNV